MGLEMKMAAAAFSLYPAVQLMNGERETLQQTSVPSLILPLPCCLTSLSFSFLSVYLPIHPSIRLVINEYPLYARPCLDIEDLEVKELMCFCPHGTDRLRNHG